MLLLYLVRSIVSFFVTRSKYNLIRRGFDQGKKGIRFSDFMRLVEAFGFTLDRVSGSHHIFKREGIEEMVNIQDYKGEAKPYQIRQFLEIVEKYGLSLEERE